MVIVVLIRCLILIKLKLIVHALFIIIISKSSLMKPKKKLTRVDKKKPQYKQQLVLKHKMQDIYNNPMFKDCLSMILDNIAFSDTDLTNFSYVSKMFNQLVEKFPVVRNVYIMFLRHSSVLVCKTMSGKNICDFEIEDMLNDQAFKYDANIKTIYTHKTITKNPLPDINNLYIECDNCTHLLILDYNNKASCSKCQTDCIKDKKNISLMKSYSVMPHLT